VVKNHSELYVAVLKEAQRVQKQMEKIDHPCLKEGNGKCCEDFGVPILEEDVYKLASAFKNNKIPIEVLYAALKKSKDKKLKECVFLVDRRCSIYGYHPVYCRNWGYGLVGLLANKISKQDLEILTLQLEQGLSVNVPFEETGHRMCQKCYDEIKGKKNGGRLMVTVTYQEILNNNAMIAAINDFKIGTINQMPEMVMARLGKK